MIQQTKLSSLTLPWPANWSAVFGAEKPLILEIGFGYGHMLEYLHQTRPWANIVGIEISSECLVRAEQAIPRKGMENVRVVFARAETALHHLFEPGSLTEVHINFPDPWFKARHAGRRLMQRDTVDALVSRLKVGGTLYLATDILDYAEMSAELLAETPGLTNLLETPWAHDMADRTVTKYERKAREVGRPCHYFAYQRNAAPAPDVPLMKELEMPHIVFKTSLSMHEMLERVEVENVDEGETYINFLHRYQGRDSLLFDVYVHEPTIDQRVSLVLVPRGEEFPDEYTLKLGAIGSPRVTEGIHRAVVQLGRVLVGLSPQNEVIHSKVRGW
ncbi:MAG: tRNA (guanosine(46)-N7)-methyltransferase TrmB [Anaerolineae bacterium]